MAQKMSAELNLTGNFDLVRYIANEATAIANHIEDTSPERSWIFDVQKAYWTEFATAHEQGKKLVFVSACAPMELIYAFDCVPITCDIIATRCATQPELAAKYVDAAQKYVPASMCGIDKVPLGAMLLGDLPRDTFDAGMFTTVPCDSSRISYPAIANMIDGPSICFDIPFQKDDQGYNYMARQYRDAIPFLENLTGKKMDWDKFQEVAARSDAANDYMNKIADLRKHVPCPLPGNVLFLNQIIPCMAGSAEIVDMLEMQYESGKMLIEMGMYATKQENWRVLWMQNMLWSNLKILTWMEKTYGACVVMETFGYQSGLLFQDPKDQDKVFYDLARKALAIPMIHGSSGPVEDYIRLADETCEAFNVNVVMNVGHVSCKHAWAAAKIVKDVIESKYGIPTMSLDVDAVDSRYKSTEEIKEVIGEFFDTLNDAKKQGKPLVSQ